MPPVRLRMRNACEKAPVFEATPLSWRGGSGPEGSVQRLPGPACGKRRRSERSGPRGLAHCGIAAEGDGRKNQTNGDRLDSPCQLRLLAGVGVVLPGCPVVERGRSGRSQSKGEGPEGLFQSRTGPPELIHMVRELRPNLHRRGCPPTSQHPGSDLLSQVRQGLRGADRTAGPSPPLANVCQISHNTAKAWLSLLEASGLLFFLLPHHRNFNKNVFKTPELYFTDTGLVSRLLGIETAPQIETHPPLEALFETFVVGEFLKGRLNRGPEPRLSFWQDRTGHEADLLLERGKQDPSRRGQGRKDGGFRFFPGTRLLDVSLWSGRRGMDCLRRNAPPDEGALACCAWTGVWEIDRP